MSDDAKIRAPRQDRSRQTMDRVLKALEELLREKPFDKITMVELAQRSNTGTSSIYARFEDKRALILGVHGRLVEHVFPCLDNLFDTEKHAKVPLRKLLHADVARVLRFYRVHGQIVRAALIVDAPFVYERQIKVYQHAANQFSELLASRLPAVDRKDLDRGVDTCVRLVTSFIHQMLIFQDFTLVRRPVSDRAIVDHLTIALLAVLDQATGGRIKDC
jgi:AcrR family transcriptional regulator